MPLPFLAVAGLAGAASLFGAASHAAADDTNEEAEDTAQKARKKYKSNYNKLKKRSKQMQESLEHLGKTKEHAINEELPRFLNAYNRVKQCEAEFENVETKLPKLVTKADLSMPVQDELEAWQAAISGAIAGGAVGMTANIVGGTVASAMTSLTPIGMVVAPAMLVSGIMAESKAEENLAEAKAYAAKANAEIQKVKTKITWCQSVITFSDKLNSVLEEVLALLSGCTQQMEEIVANLPENEEIREDSLTESEWQTIAVARALAGAAKAIIEVPLLTAKKKTVTKKSKQLCNDIEEALPRYTAILQENNAVN